MCIFIFLFYYFSWGSNTFVWYSRNEIYSCSTSPAVWVQYSFLAPVCFVLHNPKVMQSWDWLAQWQCDSVTLWHCDTVTAQMWQWQCDFVLKQTLWARSAWSGALQCTLYIKVLYNAQCTMHSVQKLYERLHSCIRYNYPLLRKDVF